MTDGDRLLRDLGEALEPERREPHEDRVAALRRAARVRGSAAVPPSGSRARPRGRRFGLPRLAPLPLAAALGVAAVLLVAGGLVGSALESDGPRGSVEYDGPLGGEGSGELEIRKLDVGRAVELHTDDLPVLPKGDYYELWFVDPSETPSNPQRISAGTFHPDATGRSDVRFGVAVDPQRYPIVSVTAEPGDGNPAPSGRQVARVRVD